MEHEDSLDCQLCRLEIMEYAIEFWFYELSLPQDLVKSIKEI